ncbi:MAG: alpha/beta fold hydrolase [Planctomycetaceae bacterium]
MPAWSTSVAGHLRGAAAAILRGRGRYFDSAGVRIRYFEQGAGEAVVLIHGFTRSAATWVAAGFTADLARDHRVIALDCRGHGQSGKPADPTAYGSRMADDVIRLLDRLNVDVAQVVGHSMGGRIALRLAASRPDRVRSAVLVASGGTFIPRAGEADPMPIETVARSLESGGGFGPFFKAILPPERPLSRWRLRLLDLAVAATNDTRVLAAVARGYAGLTVTDAELATLPMSVSVVVGSADPYQTAVTALARRVPGMQLVVVEGASHLDVLRRPEARLAVRQFLAAGRNERRRAA